MTVATTTAPSPGWYPDPQDAGQLRWWDGGAWSTHVTVVPEAGAEPKPDPTQEFHVPFVADVSYADPIPYDDDMFDDGDPIEFSWDDTIENLAVPEPAPVVEPEPEPVAEVEPLAASARAADEGRFGFRVRAIEPAPEPAPAPAPQREVPVYESPLLTISSPLPVRVAAPVEPEPEPLHVEPEPEPEPQPRSVQTADLPAPPPPPAPPARRGHVPRLALTGSAGLVVLAAAAAGVTNLVNGGEDAVDRPGAPASAPISTADRTCLKEWNTTASGTAAELRVTLGQFTGANARIQRVDPLPGTLMAPDSCALTVYDPATDTNAVFVSGVKDQVGYMDVTTYPRALDYGWPKSANQANVAIRADGTIAAI